MVTPRDLRAPFERTCERAEHRIGCEYEALAVDPRTGFTLPYDGDRGIARLLEHLRDHFDWEPVEEDGKLIALLRDHQSITLEPGGQFEMSGAPVRTLAEARAEVDRHVTELRSLEEELDIRFHWFGLNPWQSIDEVRWMPKRRYRLMRRYLPTRGDRALYMMGLTCTVQANLDYTDEADFARKLRVSTGISALVTALFANSPLLQGQPTGFKSYRSHIWTRVDPDRCHLHRFVFDTEAGFDDYIGWALDVPMFFVERDHQYVEIAGRGTFRDLRGGRIEGLHATPDDWKLHLSTLFPDVRARPHVELRSADVVPPDMLTACPALWKGILYDQSATDAAWDLVKGLSFEQRLTLADQAARHALAGERQGGRGTIGDLCEDLVAIATEGLARQADDALGEADDVAHLDPLRTIVGERRTLADRILAGD